MEGSDCVYGGHCRSGGTPQSGQEKKAAGGDHFVVEDLLDFSNKEEEDNGTNGGDDGGSEAATAGNSAYSSTVTTVDSCNPSFSGELVCRSVADAGLSGDLCEPYDDLAELEWLSNFVEESFSSEDLQKLQLISGVKSKSGSGSGSSSSETREGEVPSAAAAAAAGMLIAQQQPSVPFFLPESSTVPGKARSKRSRAAPCNWSSRLLVLSPNSATSSSDSDSILLNPLAVKKSPKPTKKKEPGLNGGPALMAASDGRRCLHCATDKTPQWRTGPMGPKTLCNACGVRYKSGRLVPEYRPAASPTFVLSKHSNSHRKVLELRRQKEMQLQQQPFMSPVASYFDGGTTGSTAAANADEFLIHHHLGPDFRQLI